jgi:cytoskeletal protein RodZ
MNVPNLPQWDFWPLVAGLVGISFLLLIVLLVLWWFAFRNKTKAKEQNRKIKVRAICPTPPPTASYSLLTPSSHTHYRTRTRTHSQQYTEGSFEIATQGLGAGAQEHGVEQPQSIFDGHPAIGRPPPHFCRPSTVRHDTHRTCT